MSQSPLEQFKAAGYSAPARFSQFSPSDEDGRPNMEADAEGDWVRASDYDAAVGEILRLRELLRIAHDCCSCGEPCLGIRLGLAPQ